MERGVYFDGWLRNNHCYHPSLPIRSMQMIDDIEKYKGTILVWSAMGGGSISLPYLEHEAFGKVDPRMRFYGYMNDSEYIAECNKRGIKVFGIVFEVQGWEFPVKYNEDKSAFKEFNVMKEPESDDHEWYGLREFSNGYADKVFGKTLRDYFPDGLYNSDGDEVLDLWEECAARDYNGVACHSEWVEVVNNKQIAYQMCRNNPVWRNYLKKIMEIQINAGVAGIQLDECELPMTSVRYGGCFCKDCMKQFNEYLKGLKAEGKLPQELSDVDLDAFNYGDYLRDRNIDYPGQINQVPFFKLYWEYQLQAIKKHFDELVIHAKQYAKDNNKDIQISGNFFNLMPSYYPLEESVDIIITEMKQTMFKQPQWYRYSAGFADQKTIIVVENPYGGIVPELVTMLDKGKGYDLFKIFLLEASAYGCNMAVPYGAWMGNTIKNAFYPPSDITENVQNFLVDKEELFSNKSGSNVLVLYDFASNYWDEAVAGYSESILDGTDEGTLSYSVIDLDDPNSHRLPFWEAIKGLSDIKVNYDVKMIADGILRQDKFSYEDVKDYELIVLPECKELTVNQAKVIEQFVKDGKKVLVFGTAGENIEGFNSMLKDSRNVFTCANSDDKTKAVSTFKDTFEKSFKDIWQLRWTEDNVGVQIHKAGDNTAIHIVNYDYNEELDKVMPLDVLEIDLNTVDDNVVERIHTLDNNEIKYEITKKDNKTTLRLFNVPVYAIVKLNKKL